MMNVRSAGLQRGCKIKSWKSVGGKDTPSHPPGWIPMPAADPHPLCTPCPSQVHEARGDRGARWPSEWEGHTPPPPGESPSRPTSVPSPPSAAEGAHDTLPGDPSVNVSIPLGTADSVVIIYSLQMRCWETTGCSTVTPCSERPHPVGGCFHVLTASFLSFCVVRSLRGAPGRTPVAHVSTELAVLVTKGADPVIVARPPRLTLTASHSTSRLAALAILPYASSCLF